ncbi:C4b-binding protein alpha chain-like [Arapaima gigas]
MFSCSILRICCLLLMVLGYSNMGVYAQCSKPPDYPNMELTSESMAITNFADGTVVNYQCALGYVRKQGSSSSTCSNGNWNPPSLECKKKSCGAPADVPNGHYNLSQGIEYGAVIEIICDKGFVLANQVRFRTCLATGWDKRDPICEVVKCPDPPQISNGQMNVDPEIILSYLDVVQYTCDNGYTLIGTSQIVCTENATFQPDPPQCLIVHCETPVVDNGIRVGGGVPPYGYKSFLEYECKEGYDLKGTAKITCDVHGWIPAVPTCERRVTGSTTPATNTTTTTMKTQTKVTTESTTPATNTTTTTMKTQTNMTTESTTQGSGGNSPGMTSHSIGLLTVLLLPVLQLFV